MQTIKSKSEFEKVYSGGKRFNSGLVRSIVLVDDEGGSSKVAFVAAKRLGNAVFRNRCKRVLREAARMCELPSDNARVIFFATRATHDSTPSEVADAMRKLLRRAGLLGE